MPELEWCGCTGKYTSTDGYKAETTVGHVYEIHCYKRTPEELKVWGAVPEEYDPDDEPYYWPVQEVTVNGQVIGFVDDLDLAQELCEAHRRLCGDAQ